MLERHEWCMAWRGVEAAGECIARGPGIQGRAASSAHSAATATQRRPRRRERGGSLAAQPASGQGKGARCCGRLKLDDMLKFCLLHSAFATLCALVLRSRHSSF